MPVIRTANINPSPSRLNDNDNPSDGAHGSSSSRAPAGVVVHISRPKTTASRAGQAASTPARSGRRLTTQAARTATKKGERMKKPITAVMLSRSPHSQETSLQTFANVRRAYRDDA